ncbi:MAG: hypothetical protein HAW64_04505, partial [Alphaproteobacteria bacterium]|nr:hypothetical protein [Alphaproteobacteria bacterium]
AILIATDEAGASYAETFTFAVDAPFIITAVDSLTINEDSAVRFGTARIWADLGGSETATLLLSAEHGSLSYAGFRRDTSSSLTYEYFAPYIYSSGDIAIPPAGRSNGGKTLQISGVNAADLSSILSTLTYTPDADYNGDDAITIGLADGAKSLTETVAVIINPVNDAPSDIGFTSHPDYAPNFVLNFASNTLELGRFDAVNFELGRFGGIDVDSSLYDIHYTLSEDSSDGVSLFRNEYLPVGILLFNGDVTGYTDGQQITATIIATDNHDASYEKTFTFTIENPPPPNQAPTDIILISNIHHSDFTMTPDGSTLFLGILHAVDADSNVRYIRYTLSDDSDDGFSFYSEGGKLLQFNGDAANYTHGQQLSATIIATDSHDNSYSKTFTFTIDNPPNQAPTDIIFMPNSHHLDFEITPDGGNIFLGLLRAVDADSNPRYISYTISDDSDDGFNGRGRLLQFNGDAANYTHGQQLSATIIATDSHDNAYSKTFTFTIDNPSNQAPTDIIFTPNSSYVNFEVAPVGDTVSLGKIKAVDADSDYIRYTLAEDSDGGFSIHTSRLSGIRLKFDGDEADYADNEEISATVIATDRHGASYSETFTFTIDNPPNQAPTDIDLRITEESGGYVFFPTGMFIELIFIPDVGADDINEFSLLYAYSYGDFGFDTPLVFSSEYAIPFEETKILLGELLVTDSDNDDTHTFAINGDSDGRFSIEDGLLYVVYNDTSFYDYFLRNGPTQYFNGYEGAEYSAFERMIEYIDPYFAAQRNDISVTITDVEGETYTETLIDIL